MWSDWLATVAYIREKGEFNDAAAQLLYDHNYYAPSVHCAYYSCFQLLKFLINDKLNTPYAQQDIEIASNTMRSHSYVWGKINSFLTTKEKDVSKLRDIRTKYKDLQLLRVRSDYENSQIDESSSRKALQYSDELRRYFRETII